MNNIKKIILILAAALIVVLFIWIAVLQHKANKISKIETKYWQDKYHKAQDSIVLIEIARANLANERIYLDSTRRYWQIKYQYTDSLLNNVKSKYNEKVSNIHSANNTKLNNLLSNKLSQINSHRK